MIRWIRNLFRKRNVDAISEGLNVVSGISKAKSLYRELIVLTHPDRHPEDASYFKELTDRINANRYNYNELLKIKNELDNK